MSTKTSYSIAWAGRATSHPSAARPAIAQRARGLVTRHLFARAPQPDHALLRGVLEIVELVGSRLAVRRDLQHACVAALDHERVDLATIDRDVREQPTVVVLADLVVPERDLAAFDGVA